MKEKKISLVLLLQKRDNSVSKDRAVSLIVCKNVYVNGELVTDTKSLVPENSQIVILLPKYVSRGGFKLEKALSFFNLDVKGKVIIDAGSSTGGFTDCLIQHGAQLVHAVDVGYNLIAYSLRTDPHVKLYEKTNIMSVDCFEPAADMAVCDLSFRSVRRAGRHILDLTKEHKAVILIKPQFEVSSSEPDFNGVVRTEQLLLKVMKSVYGILSEEGVGIKGVTISPITGRKGNKEFLAVITDKDSSSLTLSDFTELILSGI